MEHPRRTHRRLLELACGTGRVTLPLAEAGAKAGFEIVGLELVSEMLQAAKQYRRGPGGTVVNFKLVFNSRCH